MKEDVAALEGKFFKDLTDVLIRIGLIAFLIVICLRVFEPFMGLVLWAMILAVALYPLQCYLVKRFAGRQGRVATLLVLVGILMIGLPSAMLGGVFSGHVEDWLTAFKEDRISIAAPDPAVAEWPLVGSQVYEVWGLAARDLPSLIEKFKPRLEAASKFMLSMMASAAGALFQLLGSLIIAGIMMAYGQSGGLAMQRIACRVAGAEKGLGIYHLSIATIRSVAVGVIGIAVLQALLLGVGFIWAGIPGAGLLALVVLLIGIAQLPATLITLPVIAYIWWAGGDSNAVNIFFTVYLLLAGMADNVLKPLLLGRGVDAPMPVILLGALGGMISGGIMGLFLGAVVLAVSYQVFMAWVAEGRHTDDTPAETPPITSDIS